MGRVRGLGASGESLKIPRLGIERHGRKPTLVRLRSGSTGITISIES